MRLATFLVDGLARVGAVRGEGVVDLSSDFASMRHLIGGGAEALRRARELAVSSASVVSLTELRLLAPIPEPVRNVFCVGWNYLAHFDEGMGIGKRGSRHEELPEHPAFFTKATTAVIGPEEQIPYEPSITEELDFEAELAVVIGVGGRDIAAGSALTHVFGYTLGNDVSARDLQRAHGGQWMKGKSLDGTCPLGPWIVTADEIADPQRLRIRSLVNGVVKQDASTAQMIFPVARLIEELSKGMTLLPGDLILTGTPEGVGFARTPPEYLKRGDEVIVDCPEIGRLRNLVGAKARAMTQE